MSLETSSYEEALYRRARFVPGGVEALRGEDLQKSIKYREKMALQKESREQIENRISSRHEKGILKIESNFGYGGDAIPAYKAKQAVTVDVVHLRYDGYVTDPTRVPYDFSNTIVYKPPVFYTVKMNYGQVLSIEEWNGALKLDDVNIQLHERSSNSDIYEIYFPTGTLELHDSGEYTHNMR